VSWVTGVVSWLLRGVCETARHRETQPELSLSTHTHSLAMSLPNVRFLLQPTAVVLQKS